MSKYRAVFNGRRVGAQGVFYWIQALATGGNRREAEISLYDRWEHIHHLELIPIDDDCDVCEGEIEAPSRSILYHPNLMIPK